MGIRRELQIYRHCPEIRQHIRRVYIAKLMAWATVVVFSPLLLLSAISVGVVHVFDFIGQWSVLPAHKMVEWLHNFQREQIRISNSKLEITTIQKRIGEHDADL